MMYSIVAFCYIVAFVFVGIVFVFGMYPLFDYVLYNIFNRRIK